MKACIFILLGNHFLHFCHHPTPEEGAEEQCRLSHLPTSSRAPPAARFLLPGAGEQRLGHGGCVTAAPSPHAAGDGSPVLAPGSKWSTAFVCTQHGLSCSLEPFSNSLSTPPSQPPLTCLHSTDKAASHGKNFFLVMRGTF